MADEEKPNLEKSSEEIQNDIPSDESAAAETEAASSDPHSELLEQQPETSEMEVHHHAHIHSKSKWKEYIFQFFMLFLAVFCGFLAEYQLEHKIERDREKVYIKNLYEDLKDDSVHFAEYDKISLQYFTTIDSLMLLMKSTDRDLHLNRIYYLARAATMNTNNFMKNNSRTFDQMKHSGHLRLIRNQQVADSISAYYFSLQGVELQNSIIQDRISEYMQGAGRVLDAQILFQVLKSKQEPTVDSLKLVTTNEQDINVFLTNAQYYYGARKLQNDQCKERAKRLQSLVQLVQKEYHLE